MKKQNDIRFNDIPVPSDEEVELFLKSINKVNNSQKVKSKIKNKILKPIYHLIANISPSMAIKLKVYVYELRNTLII